MFKTDYFYVVAGLPDMLLDEGKIKIRLTDLRTELRGYLTSSDYVLLQILFLKHDNENILNLLKKNEKPFIENGIYSLDFLEDEIKEPDKILPYLKSFILNYKNETPEYPDIGWENELETYFYTYLISVGNEFLRNRFLFDLNLKNICIALNCRKHQISPEKELIGQNYVVESIQRSNARDFGLSQEFQYIDKILTAYENDSVLEREKAIDTLRWQWLDDNTFFHYFTIEKILGFMLKLEMVERWMSLDPIEGKKIFIKLLKGIDESYEFPADFKLYSRKK